jgi:hypothetical protein
MSAPPIAKQAGVYFNDGWPHQKGCHIIQFNLMDLDATSPGGEQ